MMFDEDENDIELSIDDLLSWKPPKPTIDIDDIVEIEKFLYGNHIVASSDIDGILANVHQYEFDEVDSDETNDCSELSPSFSFLGASGNSSFEDQITLDEETQIRLEALLEAAGVGKLPASDGKAFADPEVLRRLSSSVSTALGDATAALASVKAKRKSSHEKNQERMKFNDNQKITNLIPFENKDDGMKNEKTLLSLACAAGYCELAQVLLSVPPYADEATYLSDDSSQKLRDKINADFLSTLNQQLTKVLLSMHADAHCSDQKRTPLMEAASGGFTNIVELLLSHDSNINDTSVDGNTALFYACKAGHEDVVRSLVKHGAEIEHHNNDGHTPLMETAVCNQVDIATLLLKNNASVNGMESKFKNTALTLAAGRGRAEMVNCLVQAGADLEHKTVEMHSALMKASAAGHFEVANLLLNCGAQIEPREENIDSPLHLAVCGGHLLLVELLVERGASLEKFNQEGYTPLMEAARKGQEEMINLLCNKGAKVNQTATDENHTALSLACQHGHRSVVKLLLSKKSNPFQKLRNGSNALLETAKQGHVDVTKLLLEDSSRYKPDTNNCEMKSFYPIAESVPLGVSSKSCSAKSQKATPKKDLYGYNNSLTCSSAAVHNPTIFENDLSSSVKLSHQLAASAKSFSDAEALATIDAFLRSMSCKSNGISLQAI